MADKKISEFILDPNVLDTSEFTFVQNGTNFKTTLADIKNALGVTGTLSSIGDASGIPILNQPSGLVNEIRKAIGSKGVITSTSAGDGLSIAGNFVNGSGGVPIIQSLTSDQTLFRSIAAGQGIAVGINNGSIVVSATAIGGSNVIVINSLADFPTPSGGVITLSANTIYRIASNNVDVSPNRIVGSKGSVLNGFSTLTNTLTSNVTGDFISATDSMEISQLSINCPNATFVNYNSPTVQNGILGIILVTVISCDKIINSTNHGTLLVTNLGINSNTTNGISINGTCGFTLFDAVVIQNAPGTVLDFGTSVNSVVEVNNLEIIPASAATIPIDGLSSSGNISPIGIGNIRATNVLGTFSSTGNIVSSDLRWNFIHSNVFPDSVNRSYLTLPTNATVTVISAINTPVKILGTWTDVINSRFTNDNTGRITYIGVKDVTSKISLHMELLKSGGGTDNYTLYIAKNGVVDSNLLFKFSLSTATQPIIPLNGFISLSTNDFIEVFVENNSNLNNITAIQANYVVDA